MRAREPASRLRDSSARRTCSTEIYVRLNQRREKRKEVEIEWRWMERRREEHLWSGGAQQSHAEYTAAQQKCSSTLRKGKIRTRDGSFQLLTGCTGYTTLSIYLILNTLRNSASVLFISIRTERLLLHSIGNDSAARERAGGTGKTKRV